MCELLRLCLTEQRPPRKDELELPPLPRVVYVSDRSGTGIFDMLGDDVVVEVMLGLPMRTRILFSRSLCKQFACLAEEHKVFQQITLCTHADSTDPSFLSTEGANWAFLQSIAIDQLRVRETRGVRVRLPPAPAVRLTKLVVDTACAPTMFNIVKLVDGSRLRELKMGSSPRKHAARLLKKATHLERLDIANADLYCEDFYTAVAAWRHAHGGFPPLAYINVGYLLGHAVKLQALAQLDIEELECSICGYKCYAMVCGMLPGVRTLRVSAPIQAAVSLEQLVKSCPRLNQLMLKPWGGRAIDDSLVQNMTAKFPHLAVSVVSD